jgi:MYXO-CTERM domain-containing protein
LLPGVTTSLSKWSGGMGAIPPRQGLALPRSHRQYLVIKTRVCQLTVLLVIWAGCAAGTLRGDGIALSHDGINWFAGAGGYGPGWGNVGRGISVPKGGTLYLKYYAQMRPGAGLYYANHGAEWGSWSTAGPQPGGSVGDGPGNPVVLKFSRVGTDRATVTWVNGSGIWTALTTPGVYDLALHRDSIWSLPPITISSDHAPFWPALRRWFQAEESSTSASILSVSDSGGTGLMLGLALAALAVLWRVVHRRRDRERKGAPAPPR